MSNLGFTRRRPSRRAESMAKAVAVALEYAPVGLAICDEDGRMVSVNLHLARLLRHSRAELIGRSFLGLIYHGDRPIVLKAYVDATVRALSGSEPSAQTYAMRCVAADGRSVWGELTCNVTPAMLKGAQYGVVQVRELGPYRPAALVPPTPAWQVHR